MMLLIIVIAILQVIILYRVDKKKTIKDNYSYNIEGNDSILTLDFTLSKRLPNGGLYLLDDYNNVYQYAVSCQSIFTDNKSLKYRLTTVADTSGVIGRVAGGFITFDDCAKNSGLLFSTSTGASPMWANILKYSGELYLYPLM